MSPLQRSLTLTQLVFYGVGTMIGAGIYSVIGAAAGAAGSHVWLSFILAGMAAFLTVLSYAELTSTMHRAGAEYQFMKAAFPRWKFAAFMAGYLIALSAAATSATVALAFSGYLSVFIELPKPAVSFGLLVACTLVNIAGIRQSTWASILLISVEVAGLLLVIAAGFIGGKMSAATASNPMEWGGVLSATALIFFIYIGFEDIANLSEESKRPAKNIPRALLISVLLTSAIYLGVAISTLALESPAGLAGSDSPLALVAGKVHPWLGRSLGGAALCATASTALISLVSISRMLFGMARDGDMPRILSHTGKLKTPWIAALSLFAAACLLLPLGRIKIVASISSFGVLLVFIGVQSALIALRYRHPRMKRPFKVPFSIGRVPILPVLGILVSISLCSQFEGKVYLVGGGAVLSGALLYFIRSRLGKRTKTAS